MENRNKANTTGANCNATDKLKHKRKIRIRKSKEN